LGKNKVIRKKNQKKAQIAIKTRFNKMDFKRFLRDSLLLSLLNIVILLVLLYIGENRVVTVQRNDLERRADEILNVEHSLLGNEMGIIISDVEFLNENYKHHLDSVGGIANTANDWMNFSRSRGIVYDQLRFIDCAGNEIIRINNDGERVTRVPDALLQNKADRYYFINTMNLQPGQIYVSQLDLNIENGQVEEPYKPMIRVGAPVYNSKNVLVGVIILNYKAKNMLDNFKKLSNIGEYEQYLLNQDGYWLYNADTSKEWTFMFEDKKDISFKNTYPEEWAKMVQNDESQYSSNGLFLHMHLQFNDKIIHNEWTNETDKVVVDSGDWYIVIHAKPTGENMLLLGGPVDIVRSVFEKYYFTFIIFVLGSFLFTYFRCMLRREQMKIKFFSMYDPLTEVYNRRTGLEKLEEVSNGNERRKKRFAIVFLDVNGLKQVNDTFGHELGDELILSVTKGLKEGIREDDFVVRMGGDEFLLVLYDADAEDANVVWQRIVEGYERINQSEDRPYRISVSHGVVAVKNDKAINMADVITKADAAMYAEKKQLKKQMTIIK